MSTINKCINLMLRALPAAFILGFIVFYWIALFIGASDLQEADYFWLFVTVVSFDYLLATHNRGKQILARTLRYLAYELWLTPLLISVGMLSKGLVIGALMNIVVITSISVVLALFGLVCYVISNNLFKADRVAKKRKLKIKQELAKELPMNEGKSDAIETIRK